MSRTISFWLRPNSYTKEPGKPQVISIWYKDINGKRYQRSTDYKVAPNHWSKNERFISQKFINDYPHEAKALNEIRSKFPEQITLLVKGMPIQTIWDNLTFKRDLSQSVKDYILASSFSDTTKKDYTYHINGIIKNTNFVDVKISDLLDISRMESIRDQLKSSSLGNGKVRYLETCKAIAGRFSDNVDVIYKTIKLRKVENDRNHIEPLKFKLAINHIDTVGQLEAYLLWLYSFMLKGLTGIDIPNIDEDCLDFKSASKNLDNYHIIGDFIQSKEGGEVLQSKVRWRSIRGKRGVRINGLYNLFPLLLVRNWLHYCIGISHPQFLYNGSDRIKLFNFYTKDKKNNKILDGEKSWTTLRDTYFDQYKKMFEGEGSLHSTRHTYTHIMERLGMNESEQKKAIGHKRASKDAISSYQTKVPLEVREDLTQMEVMRNFDVIGCVQNLLKRFSDGEADINGKYYFDASRISITEFQVYAQLDKDYQENALWGIEDEIRYQKLLDEYQFKGRVEFNPKSGKVEEVPVDKNNFDGTLAVLNNRRNEFLEKIPYRLEGNKIIVDVSDKIESVYFGEGTEKLEIELNKKLNKRKLLT